MKKLILTLFLLPFLSCSQTVTTYSELELLPLKESTSIQKIEMSVGESAQVEGKVQFSNGKLTNDVIWTSENESIATVNSEGVIKAIKSGQVNILLSAKLEPTKITKIEINVKDIIEKPVTLSSEEAIKLSKEDQDFLGKTNQQLNKEHEIEKNKKPYTITFLSLNIYDNNNEFIKDVDVSARSLTSEISWNYSKKAENGNILIEDVPNECLIEITVSKEKYNTKKRLIISKGEPKNRNNPTIINFGGTNQIDKFYSLQSEPQIQKISFNSQNIFYVPKDNNIDYFSPPKLDDTYFPVRNSLNKISVTFSEIVNKTYFEESCEIISAQNSIILRKDKGIYFTWDRYNTSVNIATNLKTKGNYRLQFKKGFTDLENNQSVIGRYIGFNNQESFADYINFKID